MVLITDYTVVRTESGLEECDSREEPVCPFCKKPLSFRDRKIRIYRSYNGEKHRIRIRRLKCSSAGGCGRLHNELPAFITPYKHYISEVTENVIEGVSTPDDPTTEDYPCEKTMQRWTMWFFYNLILLEMTARFILFRKSSSRSQTCRAGLSALRSLQADGSGWLSLLVQYIYNHGGRMPAVREMHPVCFSI